MERGAVLICRHCLNLGLYERPGFEGKVGVADVEAAGRLTEEATQFYGKRGFLYDVRKAKAAKAKAHRQRPKHGM